jgi:hypothetical protein
MKKALGFYSAASLLFFSGCGDAGTEVPGGAAAPGTGGTTAQPGSGGTASGGTAGKAGGGSGTTGVGGGSGAAPAGGSAGSPVGGSAGTGTVGGSAGMPIGSGGRMGSGGAGMTGSAGTGAPAGGAGMGGSAGGMLGGGAGSSSTTCTITAMSTQSTAMPTVHTVTFTTSLTGITKAEIEFGPAAGGTPMVAPVDLMAPMYKTFLVGMKPSASYVYRVKVTSAAGTCVGADQTIMTGALANAPKPTVTIMDAAKHDKGFMIVSSGLGGTAGYILDADGTVVWVAPTSSVPNQPSRVHLSWDAKRFYAMSLNVMNTSAGKIQSVAMDGTDPKTVDGTTASHHDFTAIPGGIATLLWNKSGMDAPCSLVEFKDDGTKNTVVADFSSIYTSSTYHTNAIHYYERDDSYTIGDRNPNLYAKVSHAGALVWQFGGSSPKDAAKNFSGVTTWSVNHGHHLTADGQFVFFNNGMGNTSSAAFVYKLDTATMKATQTAKLTGTNSMVLGDAQLLPNGNVLISGSTTGTITEATTAGATVMTVKAPSGQQFGYTEFRESLYGAPPY